MIRSSFSSRCCGLSLMEMGYALLIVGFVLGILWIKVVAVYRNFDVMQASRQINLIVLAVRLVHPADKVTPKEDMGAYNLPADMVGRFKDETIVYNPWRGRVSLFPGNAMGRGKDTVNDEFTIRLDGLPSTACTDLVMRSMTEQMRALGLVSIAMTASDNQIRQICFAKDSFCLNTVTDAPEGLVENLCSQKSRVSVLYSFYTR